MSTYIYLELYIHTVYIPIYTYAFLHMYIYCMYIYFSTNSKSPLLLCPAMILMWENSSTEKLGKSITQKSLRFKAGTELLWKTQGTHSLPEGRSIRNKQRITHNLQNVGIFKGRPCKSQSLEVSWRRLLLNNPFLKEIITVKENCSHPDTKNS